MRKQDPDDDAAEQVVVAWLRGAGVSLGFPADACGECLTLLHELSEADGSVELMGRAAAVAPNNPDGPPPDMLNSPGTYLCPDCGELHDTP